MLKKFPLHSHSFLLIAAISFVSINLAVSVNTESIYGSENQKIGGIHTDQETNHYHDYLSVKSMQSSEISSNDKYYFVQGTTNSTQTQDKLGGLGQSNRTGVSAGSNNEVTSGAGSTSSSGPSTRSTGNGNLTPKTTVKCEGLALCVTGEVIKVINGKTFYVTIQNKVYKVELALIELPVQSEEAMRAATTFTRNTCLGSNVLIDQDDGQKINSFIAQVYCSPTKNLNSLLLQTGYVVLDESQCQISEFSKLDWATSYGC